MTRKNDTLWEQALNCITLVALAITYAPFMPYSAKRILLPLVMAALVFSLVFDFWKRSSYGEGELEREKRDERNRLIQTQAVWCCHVVEDWILLGLFMVFGILESNVVIGYTLMYVLVARSLLSLAIRWWLNRKY